MRNRLQTAFSPRALTPRVKLLVHPPEQESDIGADEADKNSCKQQRFSVSFRSISALHIFSVGFHHALRLFGSVIKSVVFTPNTRATPTNFPSVILASAASIRYQYWRPTPNCTAAWITVSPFASRRRFTFIAMISWS